MRATTLLSPLNVANISFGNVNRVCDLQRCRRKVSRPFDTPQTVNVVVKVINRHGDNVLKVFAVKSSELHGTYNCSAARHLRADDSESLETLTTNRFALDGKKGGWPA